MSGRDNPYLPPSSSGAEDEGIVAAVVEPEQLKGTGYGLRVVSVGILLIILAALASVGAGVSAAMGITVTALLMTGLLLMVAGQLLCLTVPAASGARGVIILCVICQLLGLMAVAAETFFGLPPGMLDDLQLTLLAAVILFLAFLRRLAGFLGRPGLQLEARCLIYGFWAIIAVNISLGTAGTVLPQNGVPAARMLFVTLSSVLVIGLIVFVVAYAHLVGGLSRAVGQLRSAE